jgi:glutamyl-tRNA synthetase
LFNWLFARHHGGKFLLRIEDTDKARSPRRRSTRSWTGCAGWSSTGTARRIPVAYAPRHAEVAHAMLASGHAYRCYMTQSELAATRRRRSASGGRSGSRARGATARPSAHAGPPFVVRLKGAARGRDGDRGQVQGRVAVQNARSTISCCSARTGTPTYMLAVVVDDHDMGVTHVIRGDDHLNNAFRQLAIVRAMEWPEPVYAHVPLIHGSTARRCRSGTGRSGVDSYRDELGVLPEALFNYLLRLGWGHGDEEIIAREDAVSWFDLAMSAAPLPASTPRSWRI